MEITKKVIAVEYFLYLVDYKTLIISDIHAGYEEALSKKGAFLPKSAYIDLTSRISTAISNLKKNNHHVDSIILNGDVIHSFSKHSIDEKYALKKIIDFISNFGNVMIIAGNHDKILSYLMKKDVQVKSNIRLGNILITHGDVIDKDSDDDSVKLIIIGHEHPAVNLTLGIRSEKFKCFLKGKYNKKDLIVMPSSNTLIEGSDVLKEKLLTPYIKNIKNFELYVIEDKIYKFDTVSRLINRM